MFRKKMTCVIFLTKVWFRVDERHTCDHRIDASINTMKYMNGPLIDCIGPHMSPYILSRNFSGLICILRDEGLKINFPVALDVHIKSEVLRNLASLKLGHMQLSIIFLIIPTLGCPSLSCQIWNVSTF
jgi:hypothetical protein